MNAECEDENRAAGGSMGVAPISCPVVELRQYTLHKGRRDRLITLFEREFIEPQDALGMTIIGTFCDLDRPDRFVWLRGFKDMDSRPSGLTQFYDGEVWKEHREAANATMIDSDNVLLVHAPSPAALFHASPSGSSKNGRLSDGVIAARICHLKSDPDHVSRLFEDDVKSKLESAGVPVLGWFSSGKAANNYPRLPVREGEQVLVWFSRFENFEAHERNTGSIADAQMAIAPHFARPPEVLRLAPTRRSKLR